MLARVWRICQPARTSNFKTPCPSLNNRAFHSPGRVHTEPYLRDTTDPYLYTNGRWLHRDRLQCDARYRKFDFPALCEKAVKTCPGATKVSRYEKKEGGFNRVFMLYLDNGERVGARVPFHIAGPQGLITNSEVATMAYLTLFTHISVPKVLDWSDNDNNSVGTEYIIMEHVPGIQLHDKWPSMSPHQHMLCMKKVAFVVAEIAKLQFPAYGSLYFADAPLDPELKIQFVDVFCIGTHCGTQYWDCNAGEARYYDERPPNRGPWTDLQSYCTGMIDAGFSRIPKVDVDVDALPYCGSVQEHLRLLSISERVLEELIRSPSIQEVATPTLLHPDIHKRNIFVSEEDPTCVTAIIDWQSTSIEPVFVYANQTPDMAEDLAMDVSLLEQALSSTRLDVSKAVTTKEVITDISEKEEAKKRHEKDMWRCRQTFEVVLKGYVPKLHNARTMDQTLLRPFRFCDASWRDSAAALRQELIELSQHWIELGLPGSCPYQPTTGELIEHAKQYEDFESVQQLKLLIQHALGAESDGWIPAESWVSARRQHQKLYDSWLETSKESGSCVDHSRKLWPFDEV